MIELYSSSSNLGDNLGYTALAVLTPCRVHMFDDSCNRCISPVFEGICDVVHDNGSPTLGAPRSNDPTHIQLPFTQRHLYALGIFDRPAIPKMALKPEEIVKAKEFVAAYPNPCVIKCSPRACDVRTPPQEIMAAIVAANPDVSFLNFGLSKNHAKHNFFNLTVPGITTFLDLPVREQAAIYHVVGRYVGPDTGDYHMMLAVGGKTDVLCPTSSPSYSYRFFHYNELCWLGETPRARYFNWNLPLGEFVTGLKHD